MEAARQFDRRPPAPIITLPSLPSLPPLSDDLTEKRLRAYARRVIESETAVLAQTPCGSRNDALNRAAFILGQYVAANLLSAQEAETWLALACGEKGNRYIQDDGPTAFRRTLHSGLKAGLAVPDVRERLRQRLFVKEIA